MVHSNPASAPVQSNPNKTVYVLVIRRYDGHISQTHPHPNFATAKAFAKLYADDPTIARIDIEWRKLSEVA